MRRAHDVVVAAGATRPQAKPVKSIDLLKGWKLTGRAFGSNAPAALAFRPEVHALSSPVGMMRQFVTFSGNRPTSKIQDWITDFTVQAKLDVLHQGFSDAVETVWPIIKPAIARPTRPRRKPFSLRDTALVAHWRDRGRACHAIELGIQANAVYTFGGPRTGGQTFFGSNIRQRLGDRTFRLSMATTSSQLFRPV